MSVASAATRKANRTQGADTPLWPKPDSIRIDLQGSAGQGLAAFSVPGMRITLRGEANDGVAKSMSGGTVVITPSSSARFDPAHNAILGNGALYGATGGALWVYGRAGDRFAVRNSGARAVVEGAGLHACEYMTGGEVAILGPLAANAGAGMTGGTLFLPQAQAHQVNTDYLTLSPLDDDSLAMLEALLADYAAATASNTAKALLADENALNATFLCATPNA